MDRARHERRRVILGIAGPPGAGKSTLAAGLVRELEDRRGDDACRLVGLDGFHLADEVLLRTERRDRKGAPETFDRAGYANLLDRLRSAGSTVYAPRFDRALEDSIAGAVEIPPEIPLVVTEGNYLLLWPEVRSRLDEVWYLDPPAADRRKALIDRHIAFGKSPGAAREWVDGSDAANADLVDRARGAADLVLDWHDTAGDIRANEDDVAR